MMTQGYDCVIGIDPGANGGIAVYTDNMVTAVRMPKEMASFSQYLEHYKDYYHPIVFIEKLSIRRDDLNGGKVFRIQKMVENYANLKAVISVLHLDYCEVHPLTWQSKLGLRIMGEEKSERKRRYKDVAQSRFPQIKVTMASCDALLIMQFGKAMITSQLKKDIKWLSNNLNHTDNNNILL